MPAVIDYAKCQNAKSCVGVCPVQAIKAGDGQDGKPKVDSATCISCGACVSACPNIAITLGEAKAEAAEEAPAEEASTEATA